MDKLDFIVELCFQNKSNVVGRNTSKLHNNWCCTLCDPHIRPLENVHKVSLHNVLIRHTTVPLYNYHNLPIYK